MDSYILIPLSICATLFGIFYLYFSTRSKERLALIEKGADASIFQKNGTSSQKVIILNIALLLMGIGIGVFLSLMLETYTTLDEEALYPACIFTVAGASLFVGFNMTKNLDK